MSTSDPLAEVLTALHRIEARLDELEAAVLEAPRRERIDLERLVTWLIDTARERVDQEVAAKERGLHLVT